MAQRNSPVKKAHTAPARPDSLAPDDLGFERQGMVSWSDPWQLIQTAIKSVLSDLFGSYADKRELLSVLGKEPVYDHFGNLDANGEFWLDYVADTGDGFDSTYTVASLAAAPEFSAAYQGVARVFPRGRVLVFGGDQVYPTASRKEYQNRLIGPYQAALPFVEKDPPALYSVPGNHDWYDGLTSFLRIFGQGRWLGGWKTEQSRSYFALQLPHGWWLWGIDIQLDSDIDHPQIEFFQKVAGEKVKDGDRIILCTAEPSWSHQWMGKKDAFATLAFFEQNMIRAYGHTLALVLSGDIHNYHRYERADASLQRVTAGGGGAFLHATHFLPEGETALDEGDSGVGGTRYKFAKAYPNHEDSRSLAKRAWRTFFKSKFGPGEKFFHLAGLVRSWGFAGAIAAYYLVFSWVLQSASMKGGGTLVQSLDSLMEHRGFWSAIWNGMGKFWYLISSSPAVCAYALILPVGLIAFCGAKGWKRVYFGSRHALLHLFTFFGLFLGLTALNHCIGIPANMEWVGVSAVHPAFIALFTVEMAVFGFFLAGLNFGLYLVKRQNVHREEVFSFQGIEEWKNFLKLRIDREGRLWLYPIGVRNVCHGWKPNPAGKPGEPWIVPETGGPANWAELIEKPLCFDPAKGKWEAGPV